MKLYHHPLSPNARRVLLTTKLLEVPVELVLVDLSKGAQRQPDYLKINPNGKVPTLVDGDLVLWESMAIMLYLCDKKPDQTLYPSEPAQRANVHRWMFWAASHWIAAASQLTFENMLKGMFGLGEPNSYAVKRAEALFGEFARTLDAQLGKGEFVAGERLTLADLAIAPTLMFQEPAKLPIEGLQNIERWFATVSALPVWQATEPNLNGLANAGSNSLPKT